MRMIEDKVVIRSREEGVLFVEIFLFDSNC